MRAEHLIENGGFRLGYCYLEWFVAQGRYAELVDVAEELGPLPRSDAVFRKLVDFFCGSNVLLRVPARYDVGGLVIYHVRPDTPYGFRIDDWMLEDESHVAGDVVMLSGRINEMVDDSEIINTICREELRRNTGPVRDEINRAILARLGSPRDVVDTIYVPQQLTLQEQMSLSESFPEYDIRFPGTSKQGHGPAAASRVLETQLLLDKANYRSKRSPENRDVDIKDLGGNYGVHFKRSRDNVHCCAPILDVQDQNRAAARKELLRDATPGKSETVSAFTERRARYIANVDERYHCGRLAQECHVTARAMIAVHSLYSVTPEELGVAMKSAKVDVCHATLMYAPTVQVMSAGELASGVHFRKHTVDGVERVSFYFTGDESLGYSHVLRDYLRWFSVPVIPCRDGSALVIEVAETRGFVARLVIRRHESVVGGPVTRRLWYEKAGYQVVTTWRSVRHGRSSCLLKRDGDKARLRREVMCVDRQFVSKVRNYALRASDKTFSLRELMSVAMSYSARTIFRSGRSVVDGPNLGTDVIAPLVVAVFVDATVQREDMAETVNLLVTEADRQKTRTGQPIVTKVVAKMMDSIKRLFCGNDSYEDVVKVTGMRAALDAWAQVRVFHVDVSAHDMFEDITQWVEVEAGVREAARRSAGAWFEDDVLMVSGDWAAVEAERAAGSAVDRLVAATRVMRPTSRVTEVGPGEAHVDDVVDVEGRYARLPEARQREVRTQTDATVGLEEKASRAYYKFAEVMMLTGVDPQGRILELGSGRGGVTQLLTERGCEVSAIDLEGPGARASVFARGDVTQDEVWEKISGPFVGVVSDLAVAIGDDYDAGQRPLLEAVLRGASLVAGGGWLVVKVRGCGSATRGFIQRVAEVFGRVRVVKPVTSRACSSEVFVVAEDKGGGGRVAAACVAAACRPHVKDHVEALEHAIAGGVFEAVVPDGLVSVCREAACRPSGTVKIGDFELKLGGEPIWTFGRESSGSESDESDVVDGVGEWIDDDYADVGGVAEVDVSPERTLFPADVAWRVVVPCDVRDVIEGYAYTPGRCLFDSIDYLLAGDSLGGVLNHLGDVPLARELRDGRWGDDAALGVLPEVLGRPVCVHRDDYCVQFGTQGEPAVHVRLRGEHYLPMRCVGTAAGELVHAISTCRCRVCVGLVAEPDKMFSTVRAVCESEDDVPALSTWTWKHIPVPRSRSSKRVSWADSLSGGAGAREVDVVTRTPPSDSRTRGRDSEWIIVSPVAAVVEAEYVLPEVGHEKPQPPRFKRSLFDKCPSCQSRIPFVRKKYACVDCAAYVCAACHEARECLCRMKEWKCVRGGIAVAARARDRARARWSFAFMLVMNQVQRRADIRRRWAKLVDAAREAMAVPSVPEERDDRKYGRWARDARCVRADTCLLPMCTHAGHVRGESHLSERATAHERLAHRSKLQNVSRVVYEPASQKKKLGSKYSPGARFTIRRGDVNRVVRDDVSGLEIECTSEGYESAYLKIQLGYVVTPGAVLDNAFMRDDADCSASGARDVRVEQREESTAIEEVNADQGRDYHWPLTDRDREFPRPPESGEADVDAAREIRHYWRVAPEIWRRAYSDIWRESVEHVRLSSAAGKVPRFQRRVRDCWEKRRPEMIFTQGWGVVTLAGSGTLDHFRAYNGESFVTKDQATDDMYLLFGDETKFMHEEQFLATTGVAMRRIEEGHAPKMRIVQGVPGCGKTEYTARAARSMPRTGSVDELGRKDDMYLLLTATRGAREDLLERVGGKQYRQHVRTIDSWLLHGGHKYREIYVDEALMVHRGAVLLAGAMAECDEMHLLGDIRQIPFINRVPEIDIRHADYDGVEVERVLSVTHRCPRDVAGAITPLYGGLCDRVTSTSAVARSRERVWVTCLDGVPKDGHDVYLVFKKSEKQELKRSGYDPVWTVHEFQGQQADNVAVVRLSDKPQEELYLRPEHSLVALTRHRRHVTYYCPVETDALVELINANVDPAEFRDSLAGAGCRVECAVERSFSRSGCEHRWDTVICMPRAMGVEGLKSRYGEFMNDDAMIEGWREYRPVLVTDDPHLLRFGKKKICVLPLERRRRYQKGGSCPASPWDARRLCPEVLVYVSRVAAHQIPDICDEFEVYGTMISRKAARLAAQFGHSGVGTYQADPDDDLRDGWRPPPRASVRSDARVETGIEMLQAFLDDIQPASCGVGKEHDGDQVEYGDLGLVLDSVRVDGSKRAAPVARWDKLQPTLRTTMSCQRSNTQVETLLALLKRNLGVPELSATNDIEELSDKMVMMFEDAYLNVDDIEDDELDVDISRIEAWMKKQKFTASSLDEEMIVHETDWSSYDFMVKRNVKPDLTRNAEWTYSALQTIATWPKKIMFAVFSPVFTAVMERLRKALKRRVVINTGYTPSEFSDRVSDAIPPSLVRDVPSLECDLKKYDKAQGVLARRVMCKLFRRFGVASHLVDMWDVANTDTVLNAWDGGVRVNVPDQCKSGESATYLRNTLWAMVTAATCFDMTDCVASLFSGDDSVLWGNLRTRDATYLYENVANLECKMVRHRTVEFCGKFLIEVEDGWAIVPNPFKAILKLGRRDMTNWYHVEAYRISASDNLESLRDGHLGYALADALRERYGLEWENAEVLVSGLLDVVASMSSFSRLFFARRGARICQDKSLPSLDI